jgi:monofunctional biosynthetic peptidoglycan transglycosylase
VPRKAALRPTARKRSGWLWRITGWLAAAILTCLILSAALFVIFRFLNPPVTMVQIQRRIEAIGHPKPYQRKFTWVPLSRISPDLRHAVISAEDGRFYEHHGIDWKQVQIVVDEARETGEVARGASTITQQLVKNLFFTTHRNPLRKVGEWVLAPMADSLLGKERTLEIYLNVVEWGDGVYGAEAASQTWFGVSAFRLSREQAARLAAILPGPRRRKPARMSEYSAQILTRMRQQGW